MSGPKVVRVITREELQAIGRRQLALLDLSIELIRSTIKKYKLDEPGLEFSLIKRRGELQHLLDNNRFTELRRVAAPTVDFFRSEAARLEAKGIAVLEAARARRRKLSDAARSLANAIQASGATPSAELKSVVTKSLTAADGELGQYQAVVDAAFRSLSQATVAKGEVGKEQAALLQRLGAGAKADTFAAWASQQVPQADQQSTRLDKALAEIEQLGEESAVVSFTQRAATVAGEPSQNQRRLLSDSLILDLGAATKQLKTAAAARAKLREIQVSLGVYTVPEAREMERQIAGTLAKGASLVDSNLLQQAATVLEKAQSDLAAVARRQAVLSGLASLGYEVRETMATAWARHGRLVVRKPGTADYGVELAAPEDASRLQVRLVGAETPLQPRNATRDKDHETTWCSEFGQLRNLVAQAGGGIHIDRALEVGAQPVKTVPFEGINADERGEVGRPMERGL
jgi:hypothetical protein